MSKRTPLYPLFASKGASFTTRGDWEIPDAFSAWEDEYRAGHQSAILSDHGYRRRLQVRGRDRLGFLHNMLSNDIKSLENGTGSRAAFLSQKGKILADLIVYRLESTVLLETDPECVDSLVDGLSRYIVSEDVQIDDVSDQEAQIALDGPRASEHLSMLQNQPSHEMLPYTIIQTNIEGVPVRLSAARHGPGPGFDLAVPVGEASALVEHILSEGEAVDLRLAGFRCVDTHRVEAGMPRFGVDMDESHLLLETSQDDRVSFSKGCYVGHEYVARLAHRGHLNRKLVGMELEGASIPSHGNEITGDGRTVGQVTSAVYSPTIGRPIALGYVNRDFFEPGTAVSIRHEGKAIPARVAAIPFVESR
jgi:folate-binding protein YgfZ